MKLTFILKFKQNLFSKVIWSSTFNGLNPTFAILGRKFLKLPVWGILAQVNPGIQYQIAQWGQSVSKFQPCTPITSIIHLCMLLFLRNNDDHLFLQGVQPQFMHSQSHHLHHPLHHRHTCIVHTFYCWMPVSMHFPP